MSASDETRRILELLRCHHNKDNQWATFVELSEAPVGGKRIDFFAVHTWASKNFRAIAYEVKVSRSDFAKELERPSKRAFAESIANQCFFVVPSGLIAPDEVPEGWGLMVATAGGLKIVKQAMQRANLVWPRTFTVAIARRMADAPPTLPAAAWKFEGREIDEAALVEVAEKTLNKVLNREQDRLRDEGYRNALGSTEYTRLVTLRDAVASAMGYRFTPGLTVDKFEKWLAEQRGGVSVAELAALHNARGALERIIDRFQQKEPPKP